MYMYHGRKSMQEFYSTEGGGGGGGGGHTWTQQ